MYIGSKDFNSDINLLSIKGVKTETLKKDKITSSDQYRKEFKSLLSSSHPGTNIVYLFKSTKPLGRLKGESNILYIGKTINSFKDRYSSIISSEIKNFYKRYQHVINELDGMYIEIFETDDSKTLEDLFLFQYHQCHLELPPLNLKSYNYSKVECFKKAG